ncbi:MAG: DUF6763 family protein [Steroidobacteraceae bacterium]|jgi:hypothetical protein
MTVQQPGIGDWYRLHDNELFEVVAIDDTAGTVEVQFFDGTLEEFELHDWHTQRASGAIRDAEPPEDWHGSVDVEPEDERSGIDPTQDDRTLNANSDGGLDLFENA